ncbi:MAG: biopolymer transporter ExbD [Spirochaetia bacterium]|jgi:biopolymer transport protein ExbD|nr:biopolymer transporter ExbD [Spirochaetia bacterium]
MTLKFKTRLKSKALIDITSLIDLVFLLVAFFMVTSSMGRESSITVHLPKALQTAEQRKGNIVVSVNEKNLIFIDDVEVAKDSFIDAVKQKKQNVELEDVVIRGDRKADYETVVFVMDALNQAGIVRFSIATEE